MKIGIIGAGYIGRMLAQKLVTAGYSVELSNSRGPATLQPFVNELGSRARAVATEAAAENDVVFLAVKWESVAGALRPLRDKLRGILIDATNPFSNEEKLINFPGTSASEIVAKLAPDALVVKAFNSLYGKWIGASPSVAEGKRVVFISGDDRDAKAIVSLIIQKMGYAPVDLGNLRTGIIQQAGYPLAGVNLVKLP